MSQCCLTGFKWSGKPTGTETKLGKNDSYVVGSNKEVAIVIVHDVFGWTANNTRLLADHFAQEVDATVYVPDFYDGEIVDAKAIQSGKFNFGEFSGRNPKDVRFAEGKSILESLKRDHGFKKLGVIGYCWGGWLTFQAGAKGQNLVDVISVAHPSLCTKEEVNALGVPVQIIAPENDPMLTPDLKAHVNSVIPTLNIPYDYQYFPGLSHGFAVRCDESDEKQKKGLERAKNAAVGWFGQFLHVQ